MLGVGAVNVLWVVYLKVKFGYEGSELAWRLGLLDIGFAVGMIVASVLIGNFLSHLAPKWFIVASLLAIGVGLGIFGYMPDYWWIFALTSVIGIFVAPMETAISTLMQIVVPNDQLGRVGGGFGTVTEAATLASMSLAGVLGAALGIPTVFLLGGIICTLMGTLAWALLPPITPKDTPSPSVEDHTSEAVLSAEC
jgi:MFS transporter, DHA3 family, macrolide efflux protein